MESARVESGGEAAFAALLDAFPVSAAPFVVTLYGDVVAPRGGELWTGSIVEALATVGIAESRVRTALSRLTAAGQLTGEKVGRRSYYRLTPAAADAYSTAARLIYAPVTPPPLRGWHLVALPDGPGREAGREGAARLLARHRFGFAGPQLALLPDRGAPLPPLPGCLFAAVEAGGSLEALVADAWPLAALAGRMRHFLGHFGPLATAPLPPATALGLRLLLVHAWRDLALADPLLPPALLPSGGDGVGNWPGPAARALFVRLYRRLSPAADTEATTRFRNRTGRLRADTRRLERRLADLAAG